MALCEQIAGDLAILFNEADFARWHEFAGRRLLCIVDTEQAVQDALKAGGLYDGEVLVSLRAEETQGLRLVPDAQVTLDGRSYMVQSASPVEGVMEVRLQQRRVY